ncbi:hypothetical protein [Burkholderia lata]|uniref:hypothetical protein n=1 Tax=Burkholderia lata (strain ATCC 17760 / DSM 23089 / LMG 22485 / NCIMB 9086 / R18194 / 383) TaxID=482957 RepID=UPI0015832D4F|nr:hypothetical protein [Burkholderia lata]
MSIAKHGAVERSRRRSGDGGIGAEALGTRRFAIYRMGQTGDRVQRLIVHRSSTEPRSYGQLRVSFAEAEADAEARIAGNRRQKPRRSPCRQTFHFPQSLR